VGSALAGPGDRISDDEAGKLTAPNVGANWFGFASKGTEKEADNQPGTRVEKALSGQHRAPASTAAEKAAAIRAREEAKYLRRLQVCYRLEEIAEDSNNADLRRRVNELKARAEDLYMKRTAHLHQLPSDVRASESALATPATGSIGRQSETDVITVPSKEGRHSAKEER
jgi:hypothetical protein